jgi:hypothetical protein
LKKKTVEKAQAVAARQMKRANRAKKTSQLTPQDLLTPGAKRALMKKKEKIEKAKKRKQEAKQNGNGNFGQEIKRARYKKGPVLHLGKKKPTAKFKSKKRFDKSKQIVL